MRQLLQCGCDLVDLLHARTGWTAANKHHDIALRDPSLLDRLYGRRFGDKNPGRAAMAIDVSRVDQRWVDGRALDDRALRSEITDRKADRRSQSSRTRLVGRHDHVVGIDAVVIGECVAQRMAALALLPPVETRAKRFAADGLHAGIEQPRTA